MGVSKYNRGRKFMVDNSEFPYIKLKELVEGRQYPVFGYFVTKDNNGYGEGAVLITADYNVNIPTRYISVFREWDNDPEITELINAGKVAFKYEKGYSEKYRTDTWNITWIDVK